MKTRFAAVSAFVVGACLAVQAGGTLSAGQKSAAPKSKEAKIHNAMSAAPKAIAKEATILDWPAKQGAEPAVLRQGGNDWTCLPDNPGSPGNDPMCWDKAAKPWLDAYMMGEKAPPKLTQPGIVYMLQGGSDASNTDPFATKPAAGEQWVTAPAHLMIFPVEKLDPQVYGTDPHSGGPWIMWDGTPYQHIMIPVK